MDGRAGRGQKQGSRPRLRRVDTGSQSMRPARRTASLHRIRRLIALHRTRRGELTPTLTGSRAPSGEGKRNWTTPGICATSLKATIEEQEAALRRPAPKLASQRSGSQATAEQQAAIAAADGQAPAGRSPPLDAEKDAVIAKTRCDKRGDATDAGERIAQSSGNTSQRVPPPCARELRRLLPHLTEQMTGTVAAADNRNVKSACRVARGRAQDPAEIASLLAARGSAQTPIEPAFAERSHCIRRSRERRPAN